MEEKFDEIFYIIKKTIEDNCYTFDDKMLHAYCKVCGEETGAGAFYNHKPNCKVKKLEDFLYTIRK